MNSYEAYSTYLALRTHFSTERYDYFANNGKIKSSVAAFEKRKDKWMFARLGQLYTESDYRDLIISNTIKHFPTNVYTHMLMQNEAKQTMLEYQKVHQSISYIFDQDMDILLSEVKKPDDIFKIEDGQFPIILQKVFSGEIHRETMIILNNYLNFFPMVSRKVSDTFSWDLAMKFYKKYKPFIKYDDDKIRSIIKEKVNV